MIARYFVVEGKTDELILKKLLPDSLLHDTKIIVSSGYSAALSITQSLFTLTPLPVSFFFDADTYSDDKVEERKQFINSYLKKVFANEFLLFPFKPEIEILFFYRKELLENIMSKEISNELWSQGQYQPGKTLIELVGNRNNFIYCLEKLSPDIVQELQQNPIIQNIIQQHESSITHQAIPA
jgi:hypothetical protein